MDRGRVAAWNKGFEEGWLRKFGEAYDLIELQPREFKRLEDYAKERGWECYSPVAKWEEIRSLLAGWLKEQAEKLEKWAMKLEQEQKAGEAVGLLGEFWSQVEDVIYELKICCDVGVSWKNYSDILYEARRLRELRDPSESDTASKLLQILGSHPNCLMLCLAFEEKQGIILYLKLATPFLKLLKQWVPDIELHTKLTYYRLLEHLGRIRGFEIVRYL